MSRTEFKILKESDFWTLVFKPSNVHSDQISLQRNESGPLFKPVHRLDLETQGLLMLAEETKWEKYHSLFLESSVDAKATIKLYLAGSEKEVSLGQHSGFIGSRYRSSKKTRFAFEKNQLRGYHSVLAAEHEIENPPKGLASLLGPHTYQIKLISGRRHQIRAFFAALEAPLVGDTLYGSSIADHKLALFSWKLSFTDPLLKKDFDVEAPVEKFQKV